MPRGDLFPEIGPFQTGFLPLPDGHTMYWEQVGNPRGVPVLFLDKRHPQPPPDSLLPQFRGRAFAAQHNARASDT